MKKNLILKNKKKFTGLAGILILKKLNMNYKFMFLIKKSLNCNLKLKISKLTSLS